MVKLDTVSRVSVFKLRIVNCKDFVTLTQTHNTYTKSNVLVSLVSYMQTNADICYFDCVLVAVLNHLKNVYYDYFIPCSII